MRLLLFIFVMALGVSFSAGAKNSVLLNIEKSNYDLDGSSKVFTTIYNDGRVLRGACSSLERDADCIIRTIQERLVPADLALLEKAVKAADKAPTLKYRPRLNCKMKPTSVISFKIEQKSLASLSDPACSGTRYKNEEARNLVLLTDELGLR